MNFKIALAAVAAVGLAGTAQAADLAKKAPAAADYVKVCDAYGAGFFYIPGSDTCLQISGYVRAELRTGGHNDQMTPVAGNMNIDSGRLRTENNLNTRARMLLDVDARTNTEFGLLRSFIELRETISSGNGVGGGSASYVELLKAFVQFGGLTAGRATSFFDFVAGGYVMASMLEVDTSDHDVNLFAYTFSFGNGITATLSVEDPSTSDATTGLRAGPNYGGVKAPDLVGTLAVTQAWGKAQLSAALHDDYGAVSGNKLGFAVLGGVEVNLPMIAAGDKAYIQGIYSKGVIGYALNWTGAFANGVSSTDFDYDAAGALKQSTAWSISGGLHHEFTKQIVMNLGASYGKYTDGANSAMDYSQVVLSGELRWMPVKGLYIAPAVDYRTVDFKAPGLSNGNQWDAYLRIQRNF